MTLTKAALCADPAAFWALESGTYAPGTRHLSLVTVVPMPWRLVVACASLGIIGGAILGFIRGLNYIPTLFFAVIEGAILFGVPAALLGLLLVACWSLATSVRRHIR
jgi:hypothetical protein